MDRHMAASLDRWLSNTVRAVMSGGHVGIFTERDDPADDE